jgi:hypothetical protein
MIMQKLIDSVKNKEKDGLKSQILRKSDVKRKYGMLPVSSGEIWMPQSIRM